jgi:hypothetical protein
LGRVRKDVGELPVDLAEDALPGSPVQVQVTQDRFDVGLAVV